MKTNEAKNTYHRDGSITYWSVYEQRWIERAHRVPAREMAAMNQAERGRALRHILIHGDSHDEE